MNKNDLIQLISDNDMTIYFSTKQTILIKYIFYDLIKRAKSHGNGKKMFVGIPDKDDHYDYIIGDIEENIYPQSTIITSNWFLTGSNIKYIYDLRFYLDTAPFYKKKSTTIIKNKKLDETNLVNYIKKFKELQYLITNVEDLSYLALSQQCVVKYNSRYDFMNNYKYNLYSYKPFMITYFKNYKRANNYYKINKIFNYQLEPFEAEDGINNYDNLRKEALDGFYCTNDLLKYTDREHGKLGCNLSHQKILEKIRDNNYYNLDWFLIMEDDLEIDNDLAMKIQDVLNEIKTKNIQTDYVQLWSNKNNFKDEQISEKNKISGNIYKMIFQWGAVAFLISKNGIDNILSKYPIDTYMDIFYSNNRKDLNSIYYDNKWIDTKGALDGDDKTSEFGSIIWNT